MKKIIETIISVAGAITLGSLLCAPLVSGFVWLDYSINAWHYNAAPTEAFIKICFIVGVITWIGFIFVVERNKSDKK